MKSTLYGPFSQILTMDNLPLNGPISNAQMPIIYNGGIVTEKKKIIKIGQFDELRKEKHQIQETLRPLVLMPGFIDAHTHICFAGDRAADYTARLEGKSYQEIAAQGGGILDTVRKTRQASQGELSDLLLQRLDALYSLGVTTVEVKSGYGLTVEHEIKMLKAITALRKHPVKMVTTCLAAHTLPPEFDSPTEYLGYLLRDLLPIVKKIKISNRVDIFVEKGAFTVEQARNYLLEARKMGFELCIHADQFSRGGAQLAAELHAVSADHLEQSTQEDFEALKQSHVSPIVLPGSSLGLGLPFAPAREMLDCGLPLVIASDWNPGSAPMGNLLTQAAILGAAQHLTVAETLAAITIRAAHALRLKDRGILKPGYLADMIVFPCADYREILYYQGSMMPNRVE